MSKIGYSPNKNIKNDKFINMRTISSLLIDYFLNITKIFSFLLFFILIKKKYLPTFFLKSLKPITNSLLIKNY